MKFVFADTSFFLAWGNETDAHHVSAAEWSKHVHLPMLTTAWVITELMDGLCHRYHRKWVLRLFQEFRSVGNNLLIPPREEWFDRGLKLYESRPDKDWSLTDCISFEVMTEYGVSEALTGDRHFEQAGFKALFLHPLP